MSDTVTTRPAICLSMIVKNEAHVIADALDSVAPYISSWVVVDTGSDDGTQDVIRNCMVRLGIPGELYERPWRNFGDNRTEAVALAQGHGDYIWVMDADDLVVGTPDFTGLDADIYFMRLNDGDHVYWYPLLFRDGVDVRYEGATHESPRWDDECVVAHLESGYRIEDRHLGSRSVDPQKYSQDRDVLLAEIERNPDDMRSVFFLAQSYFNMGDFANARTWYQRRVDMGGWEEQVFYSMYQAATAMANLGEPWPEVQDAYLRAWEFRPTRAEPLLAIAARYREDHQHELGYLFAACAVEIPFPEGDILLVRGDIYAWRAADELAVCA
ncbi:MAG: glycosyltransferase, partial [Mycobacterium sp.]